MVLEEEEEEGGTDFLIRLVVEFGFRSRWEDMLDGKGEIEEREGEEKEAEDDEDDAGVEDSRLTNSTNESR